VIETVQIDPAQISEDSPIVIGGTLVTNTTIAKEQGLEIPAELGQLRLTFTLNRHLSWEDGKPVTSADVAEMFRVRKDPELQLASRYLINRLARVDTPDAYTVVQTYVPGYLESDYYTTFIGLSLASRQRWSTTRTSLINQRLERSSTSI
jgi:ABC-type transport system substrate-binding protein